MIDADGRCVEVIFLDHGDGPRPWYRVSRRRVLLGRGYYRRDELADVLALVDVESLVEVIPFPGQG